MNESQNPFNENGTDNGNSPTRANPSARQAPEYLSSGNSQNPQGVQGSSASNVAPTSNGSKQNQPEYGQVKVPEYGAMASQFSPEYNPYVYGKPEEKPKTQNQNLNQQNPQMNPQGGQPSPQMGRGYGNGMGPYQGNQENAPYWGPNQMQGGYGNNPNNPYGQPYNNGQMGGPGTPGYQPDIRNGVDMNDPVQNPLKGHWDSMAILSVILLFLPITFLPAITGAVSMWRTKKYHMKGFWVATVCMVLGVIATLFELWLFSKGISVNDLSQQLLNQYGSGSGGSSGSNGGGSVSA